MKIYKLSLLFIVLFQIIGCASVGSRLDGPLEDFHGDPISPVYAGTKWSLSIINNSEVAGAVLVGLPFCFVLDTFLLPVTLYEASFDENDTSDK